MAQRLKSRNQLNKVLDLKAMYGRVLGFFGSDEEEEEYMQLPSEDHEDEDLSGDPNNKDQTTPPLTMSSNGSSPDLKKKGQKQNNNIHEDVIREVDESPMSVSSSLNRADNVPWGTRTGEASNKVVNNIKKSLGALAGVRKGQFGRPGTSADHPVRLGDTAKQFELKGQNRKIAMSGMLGMKPRVTPEIRAVFGAPTVIEDLDEFTEEFFAQDNGSANPSSQNVTERDKSRKKVLPNYLEMSSSILDLEESRFQATPKEATLGSATNPRENVSLTPRDQPNALDDQSTVHPSHTFQEETAQGRNLLTNGGNLVPHSQQQPALKEQNTMGTVASTNLSSSLVDNNPTNKGTQLLGKLHKVRAASPFRPAGDSAQLRPPQTPGAETMEPIQPDLGGKPLLNVPVPATEAPQASPVPTEEAKGAEPEEITEKLVLVDKDIALSSAIDVFPTGQAKVHQLFNSLMVVEPAIAPYKARVHYVPTELPEDEDDDAPAPGTRAADNATINETVRGITASKRDDASSSAAGDMGSRKSIVERSSVGQSLSSGLQTKSNPDNCSLAESSVNNKKDIADPDDEGKNVILTVQEELARDREEDPERPKNEVKWSGQEVLAACDPYAAVYMTSYMSGARLWAHGWKGKLAYVRTLVRNIFTSGITENLMNLLVLTNTITLALDRYNQPSAEDSAMNELNIVFTAIFTFELAAKLFGMGIVKYLSDPFNQLDGAVVIFSLVEIIFLNGQGALSAFRSLRIFRTVRVLRVARLLRSLRSMQMIIDVIGETIGSFAYIGLLLLIFIFIYALFGMQFFGGAFNFADGKPRQNFDSFNNAFMTIYQVLTMENWQSVLYYCMRAQTPAIAAIYLITWIFIGNYILLNLFLAIMLDAFTAVDEEMEKEAGSDQVWPPDFLPKYRTKAARTSTLAPPSEIRR